MIEPRKHIKCDECGWLISYPTRGCQRALEGAKTFVDNTRCTLGKKRFDAKPILKERAEKLRKKR